MCAPRGSSSLPLSLLCACLSPRPGKADLPNEKICTRELRHASRWLLRARSSAVSGPRPEKVDLELFLSVLSLWPRGQQLLGQGWASHRVPLALRRLLEDTQPQPFHSVPSGSVSLCGPHSTDPALLLCRGPGSEPFCPVGLHSSFPGPPGISPLARCSEGRGDKSAVDFRGA